mgnify:CR=1 FL=1
MSRKTLATALVVVFLILPGCFAGEGDVSFEGTAISGPVAGDFTLTDQAGNEVSLRDYEGDVVVVFSCIIARTAAAPTIGDGPCLSRTEGITGGIVMGRCGN